MLEAQGSVPFDGVEQYLTEGEWLRLDREQRTLEYFGNVTSVARAGVPGLNPALVPRQVQGQVLLVSDPSLIAGQAKHSENISVTQHETVGENAQPHEMASTSSPRAGDPSPEVRQNRDTEGRLGSPQNLPLEHHFACKECGDSFRLKVLLVQHQRIHSEETVWECRECGKVFRGITEFKEHRKSHVAAEPRPGPSQALEDAVEKREQMEKEEVNTQLSQHQKLHASEKPFACEACSVNFLDRQEFLKHQRTHTGHLPFDCDDCGKSFRGVSGLAEHQRIHSGAKPYGCPHCGKLFRRSSELTKHRRGPSDLIKHRRIHSGLKPYECDRCGKAFRRSSGLSRHRRIHSGARRCECSECGRVFKRRSALHKHQPTHRQ
uniref:C2H2-type domain-containing protein n=1 Tax=Loxodonta africana TaxID=9785 RepID=G3UM37_LOXAF